MRSRLLIAAMAFLLLAGACLLVALRYRAIRDASQVRFETIDREQAIDDWLRADSTRGFFAGAAAISTGAAIALGLGGLLSTRFGASARSDVLDARRGQELALGVVGLLLIFGALSAGAFTKAAFSVDTFTGIASPDSGLYVLLGFALLIVGWVIAWRVSAGRAIAWSGWLVVEVIGTLVLCVVGSGWVFLVGAFTGAGFFGEQPSPDESLYSLLTVLGAVSLLFYGMSGVWLLRRTTPWIVVACVPLGLVLAVFVGNAAE
ncbi:MAG: hypothetical protein M3277_03845 [Actinomycetota bacterium]|nr:hypothetical protein [Actinomycetota bacterium]